MITAKLTAFHCSCFICRYNIWKCFDFNHLSEVEFINKYFPEIFPFSVPATVETLTIHSVIFLNHCGTDLLNRKSCRELQDEREEQQEKNRLTEKKDDGVVKDLNYKL